MRRETARERREARLRSLAALEPGDGDFVLGYLAEMTPDAMDLALAALAGTLTRQALAQAGEASGGP